jgi:hypothetical protein
MSIEIELGGQTYDIKPLPMRQSRMWREKFSEPIQAILGLLRHAEDDLLDDEQNVNMRAVAVLLSGADLVLKSPDVLVEALFAYSDELADKRAEIEEAATDEEALAALWEVVTKLAYPFGFILNKLPSGAG